MDVIEEARGLLQGRLDELDAEKTTIEKSLAALAGTNGHAARRRPGRPKGSTRVASKGPKGKRARRSGGRADQAVDLITAKPGISASDVAKKMKIKPNYLYRVLGGLEAEGRVRKEGRNYWPA